MEAQGYRWSDRDGWVTDEQAREYQAQRDRAWKEHLKQDAELGAARGRDQEGPRGPGGGARGPGRVRQEPAADGAPGASSSGSRRRPGPSSQQADWVGRAVDAVQMAADTAIGELAEVTGPVGQAIRAGYNAAKGMATVVGEAIAEGRGLKPADIRRGLWLGAENVAMDMGHGRGRPQADRASRASSTKRRTPRPRRPRRRRSRRSRTRSSRRRPTSMRQGPRPREDGRPRRGPASSTRSTA